MQSPANTYINRRYFIQNALLATCSLAFNSFRVDGNSLLNVASLSLAEVSNLLFRKKISPVEVTNGCLKRIEQLNPTINAFISVTEEALKAAKEAEKEIRSGRWKGLLHGVPIALKDNIDTAGIKTTAATAVFKDRIPLEDAAVVQKLKAAGAIIIGKLNMHECAHGTTSAVSFFGPVHNPWNVDLIAGGSSGGAGAAVAACLCYGAIGTDTGASIRLPAACCGIVGLKPTYGLVSKRGVIPDSWSFDHVGPMCRTVTDTAILLHAIAGYDRKDEYSIATKPQKYADELQQGIKSFRLGKLVAAYYEEHDPDLFYKDLPPEIEPVINEALRVLAEVTAGFQEVRLPAIPDLFATVADVEAYTFYEPYLQQSPQLFQPSTYRQLLTGEKITAAQYINGLHRLYKMRHNDLEVFKTVDFLVTPTTSAIPLRITDCTEAFQMPANTGVFNIYGLPAISIPCGFTASGLPVGLQIAGPRFSEDKLLALAHAYENATEWHERIPVLSR